MTITTKAELFSRLQSHHAALRSYGVRQYGVFGSFVRDEPQETSDIDLLVEFEPGQKTFTNFIDLAFYLEDVLGRRVEVVTKEALSPHIGPHILQEVEYVTLTT